MEPQYAIDFSREAIRTCITVGGPILALTLVLGLLISVLQAMTQLHDQAISYVPKILLLMIALGLCLPWLSDRMIDFAKLSFEKPMPGVFQAVEPFSEPEQVGPFEPQGQPPESRVAQRVNPVSLDQQEDPPRAEPSPQPRPESPFILPHYRYQTESHEDLEG